MKNLSKAANAHGIYLQRLMPIAAAHDNFPLVTNCTSAFDRWLYSYGLYSYGTSAFDRARCRAAVRTTQSFLGRMQHCTCHIVMALYLLYSYGIVPVV